jgi:glycosyltransferase involved in cell wall biosynthesis
MVCHPVGLAHDYLLVMRGAERTFWALSACWPRAPIYTLLFDREATGDCFAGRDVRTSSLQQLHVRQAGFKRLLPLFPTATERLPIEHHQVVVSSSSAFIHGVRLAPDQLHICYCHSPFRYAWHERQRGLEQTPAPLRPLARRSLDRIRRWDVEAARRVSLYVANSRETQQRIADYYGRDSIVVHPPVDLQRFTIGEPEDFFLLVRELVAHKRTEVALEAARRAGVSIKVVGTGPALSRYKARFGGCADFVGRVSDAELATLYRRARAVVVPNVEEFGIVAVEAQASGRPVIAADGGGARETVVPGVTGVLVPPGDVDAMAEAMRDVDFDAFSPERTKRVAQRFSVERFQHQMMGLVADAMANMAAGQPVPRTASYTSSTWPT